MIRTRGFTALQTVALGLSATDALLKLWRKVWESNPLNPYELYRLAICCITSLPTFRFCCCNCSNIYVCCQLVFKTFSTIACAGLYAGCTWSLLGIGLISTTRSPNSRATSSISPAATRLYGRIQITVFA